MTDILRGQMSACNSLASIHLHAKLTDDREKHLPNSQKTSFRPAKDRQPPCKRPSITRQSTTFYIVKRRLSYTIRASKTSFILHRKSHHADIQHVKWWNIRWKMPFISSHSLNLLSHRHIADKRLCVSRLRCDTKRDIGDSKHFTNVTLNFLAVSSLHAAWHCDSIFVFENLQSITQNVGFPSFTSHPIDTQRITAKVKDEGWFQKSFIGYIHTTNLHPFLCKERTYRQLSIFFLMTLTE